MVCAFCAMTIFCISSASFCDSSLYKILHEFIQYKLSSLVIRMNQVNIIKTIITQNVDDEFISGKIIYPVEFIYEMMYHFNQPGFTSVIFCDTIADMTHRAYCKNNFQRGIEPEQLVNTII